MQVIILSLLGILPPPVVDHDYLDQQQVARTPQDETLLALNTGVAPRLSLPAIDPPPAASADCQAPAAPVMKKAPQRVTRYRRVRSRRAWRSRAVQRPTVRYRSCST